MCARDPCAALARLLNGIDGMQQPGPGDTGRCIDLHDIRGGDDGACRAPESGGCAIVPGVNARARVEAALASAPVDRPPAGAWGHTYREEWSPQALARVTIERQRRYGWDFVKFQPRASCFAEAFGAVFRPAGHPFRAPKLERVGVSSIEDWSRLPDVDATTPSLADQVEAIGMVARELGPDVPVIQTVFSPLSVASYLSGRDERALVRTLRSTPEVLGPALDRIGDVLGDFARRSVAAGAAGVFYAVSSGFASRAGMPMEVYERLVLPHDARVLEALPGDAWFNVLHLCGSNLHFDLAARMPNIQVVSWSVHNRGNPSLAAGRDRARRPVMGGLAQRTTLARGRPEEVVTQAREALRETGGRGVLLAPGCSVPPAARTGNLVAMMEAVRG